MNDDAISRLEDRIARLERANRGWRRLAASSALILACAGMMAAQRSSTVKADQIEAKQIVVRDAAGREIITLGMLEKKYPGMQIKFPGSGVSSMYFASQDHATLSLSDNNGSSSLTLNSGGANSLPDISLVKVGPGAQVKRLFRAPAPQ